MAIVLHRYSSRSPPEQGLDAARLTTYRTAQDEITAKENVPVARCVIVNLGG